MVGSFGERLKESKDAFVAVFENTNLRYVQLSWAASNTAYWVFSVALALYAYDKGGAGAVGLVGLLRMLPSVVAAPFAAALGDRYSRQFVILVVNVARTATIILAAAVAFLGAPAMVVYLLASLIGLLQSVFRPTQAALLPVLARSPEELTAANLVLTTIEGVGIFVGPAIGGVLLAVVRPEWVFVVSASGFLVSAVVLALVRAPREVKASAPAGELARGSLAGFTTISRDRNLRLIVGLYGAQTLVAGALNVLLVVCALELLHLGNAGIGFLTSAVGVGALIGGVAALALLARARLASDFALGLVLWGLPILLIGIFPNAAIAIVLLGVVGIGSTLVDVAGLTLLQRAVPDEVLTRVLGVVQSVFVATLGLGAIVTPVLISALGIRGALIATGALLPALAILSWRRLVILDEQSPAPVDELELLRQIPLFRPLPAPVLDELASSLIPVTAVAGEQIIREGDQGDRFYVIRSGEVEVSAGGQPVATLGAGDYAGEIALLKDVPRTATITAKTDVELYALERDEFLSAVTGHAASAEAADAVVASRLAGLRPGIASL